MKSNFERFTFYVETITEISILDNHWKGILPEQIDQELKSTYKLLKKKLSIIDMHFVMQIIFQHGNHFSDLLHY